MQPWLPLSELQVEVSSLEQGVTEAEPGNRLMAVGVTTQASVSPTGFPP